jgi:WD40 repeat protein
LSDLEGHTGQVKSLSFSSDQQTLASAADDMIIRFWDVQTKQSRLTLREHSRTITSLAFSSEGKSLASSSEDGTIKLWDTETASCKATLRTPLLYEGMNITGVKGLTEAELTTLKALGAVDHEST